MWFHVEIKFSFFEPPYKTTIIAANRRRKKVVNVERKREREREREGSTSIWVPLNGLERHISPTGNKNIFRSEALS